MRIVMDMAREHGVPMLISSIVDQFVSLLIAEGRGDEDYAMLITVMSRMADAHPEA